MRTIKPMRHWMQLTEGRPDAVTEDDMPDFQSQRKAFYGGNLPEKRQAALDALDRVLGHQSPDKMENVRVLREIEATAKRMADGIERHLRPRGLNASR